ncbi:rhodanese-like domain-containing protein [Ramlibacter montanisoli]|jgi:rhodanese-related sulfurtransferase|uniref:Sulfurtransferase n=1 Tax=Ramlibacter montanisoli TaxID=2732512 RepID=A0A849KCJ7_9BURK|nr:rhodanese-like domain-containing protein [Ramlibacter montanisoli]NNU43887.1 sulfurtransferase [Ramlibacter montanisoli]
MIPQVRPSDFDDWLQAQGARPLVLDVREPWEVQTASVAAGEFDLVAIPMNEVPGRLDEIPQDRPVAILCHHGARSQRVAMFLAHQGYTDVANIAGGIEAWSRERDPAVPRY